jgi:hypothetical protein
LRSFCRPGSRRRGELTARHRNIKRIPNSPRPAGTRDWLSGGSASLMSCLIFFMRD